MTSNDVIHSFALPECGIKIDALPGRLNQVFAEFIRVGNYTGMCSELCGVGHAKMPINVIAMSNEGYILYTQIFHYDYIGNLYETALKGPHYFEIISLEDEWDFSDLDIEGISISITRG